MGILSRFNAVTNKGAKDEPTEQLQSEYKQAEVELNAAYSALNRAKAELADKEDEVDKYRGYMDKARGSDKRIYQRKFDTAEADIATLNSKVEELTDQIEKMESIRDALKGVLDTRLSKEADKRDDEVQRKRDIAEAEEELKSGGNIMTTAEKEILKKYGVD